MLLTTKLFTPQQSQTLVERPHLCQRLENGLACKVILVAAPAGFGKTTLVSQWLHSLGACARSDSQVTGGQTPRLQGSSFRAAWLSLDASDDDPIRFFTYLLAALQQGDVRIGSHIQTMLATPQPPSLDILTKMLLNELVTTHQPLVIVLDDYHTITNTAIHQAITFLVEQMPPLLHLILLTRADPSMPLARWRARRELLEIRERDLRFTRSETTVFLNSALEYKLTPEDIDTLEQRTEGWVAGLQLAALSLRNHANVQSFIQNFAGSHVYILDYLSEEVLAQQTPEIRTFLLQTSILERMCASLCNAVAGTNNGQETLERLQRANLFMVPLDDERRWYRYHHLFAEVLRSRLLQEHADLIPHLHRRACHWCTQQGLLSEAIAHALAADDIAIAVELIEQSMETLLKQGEHGIIHGWLKALPDAIVYAHPQLSMARAADLIQADQPEAAEVYLQAAAHNLASAHADPNLLGQLYSLRARNAQRWGRMDQALVFVEHALQLLPEENRFARSQATLFLGNTYVFADRVADAIHAFAEAARLALKAGDIHTGLHATCNQAIMEIAQGRLHSGRTTLQHGLRLAVQYHARQITMAGALEANLGTLFYEWNQLAEAEAQFRSAIAIYGRSSDISTRTILHCHLALLLHARGNEQAARDLIEHALQWGRQQNLPESIVGSAVAFQVRLWTLQEDISAVLGWLTGCNLSIDDDLSVPNFQIYSTLARALFIAGRFIESAHLLERLIAAAEQAGRKRAQITLRALQALVWQAQGNHPAARQSLAHTLIQAAPEGYIRTFIDEGEPMRQLLAQCKQWLARSRSDDAPASQNGLSAYVEKVLSAFPTQPPNRVDTSTSITTRGPKSSPHVPTDALSPRELEVLHLVNDGLSNTQIAEQLVVTPGTVKRHINSIFGKLSVTSRTQALARARALQLL